MRCGLPLKFPRYTLLLRQGFHPFFIKSVSILDANGKTGVELTILSWGRVKKIRNDNWKLCTESLLIK